jgi:hypothetical protein
VCRGFRDGCYGEFIFYFLLFFEAKTFEFELEEGASVVRIYER